MKRNYKVGLIRAVLSFQLSMIWIHEVLARTILRQPCLYLFPMLANLQMDFKILDAFSRSCCIQLAGTVKTFDARQILVRKMPVAFIRWRWLSSRRVDSTMLHEGLEPVVGI
jgi:hypothetical protein